MVVGMYVCTTRYVLQVGTPPRNFPIVKNAAVPIFSTSICVEKFFSSSKVGGGEIRTSCFGRAHFCSYPPSRLVTSTSLMDHAAVIPIADVHLELDVHRKVRIAGLYVMNFFFFTRSCVSYDPISAEAILEHEHKQIVVDLSLVVEHSVFSLPPRSKLMCLGTLERRCTDASNQGTECIHSRTETCVPLILRAIFAKVVDELDLRLWATAARRLRAYLSEN